MADGMPNPLPAWIDADFSERLPELVAAGERADLELKEEFPAQATHALDPLNELCAPRFGVCQSSIRPSPKVSFRFGTKDRV